MIGKLRKKLYGQIGQSLVEYIILVAVVIAALIFFLGRGGVFEGSYNKTIQTQGDIITGDSDSYRYLVESIRMHPDQETLLEMMKSAGLENCKYQNVIGGICAIHVGFKPASTTNE